MSARHVIRDLQHKAADDALAAVARVLQHAESDRERMVIAGTALAALHGMTAGFIGRLSGCSEEQAMEAAKNLPFFAEEVASGSRP